MEKSYISVLLRRNIGTQRDNLLLLLLAAIFLASLTVGSTSPGILRSFQSPISPVISPLEPAAGPAATPTTQPAAPPSAASTPVLWIVIGLVVVGTFVVGLVFFQKRCG